MINTESMTGFSNALELRALHDACTLLYEQNAAQILILKHQHSSFLINQDIKQWLKAVLFRCSQRAIAKAGIAGNFATWKGWSSSQLWLCAEIYFLPAEDLKHKYFAWMISKRDHKIYLLFICFLRIVSQYVKVLCN